MLTKTKQDDIFHLLDCQKSKCFNNKWFRGGFRERGTQTQVGDGQAGTTSLEGKSAILTNI